MTDPNFWIDQLCKRYGVPTREEIMEEEDRRIRITSGRNGVAGVVRMNEEPWETWKGEVVRDMQRAMMVADDRFEADGATGTKNYIRNYYIPALIEYQLRVVHEKPTKEGSHEEKED